MSELGNLMADILLSPWRMSTVKIRAGSLFCTPVSRIGAGGAGFAPGTEDKTRTWSCFPRPSTAPASSAQVVHRHIEFRTCGKMASCCKVG